MMLEENTCSWSWPRTGLEKYVARVNQFFAGNNEYCFLQLHISWEQQEFEQANGSGLTKSLASGSQSIFT